MKMSLPVVNAEEARFECIYGRGCDGICCQNGRPSLYAEEVERVQRNLKKFLPELLPRARKLVEREGFMSRRMKLGLPMMRVIDGWCVFFNKGCVLHKIGAQEGDKYRYKPSSCALFPLSKNEKGEWFIRQQGLEGEEWNLFCLEPGPDAPLARETLAEEIKLAAHYEAEAARRSKRPLRQRGVAQSTRSS